MAFNKEKWLNKYAGGKYADESGNAYMSHSSASPDDKFDKEKWLNKYAGGKYADGPVLYSAIDDAILANNPAFVYAQVYGNGKTGTAANKPVQGKERTRKSTKERKPGEISALGAGDYGASKPTRFDDTVSSGVYSTVASLSNLVGLSRELDARTRARDEADSARLKKERDAALAGEDINTRKGGLKKQHEDNVKDFEQRAARVAGVGKKYFDNADEFAERAYEYEKNAKLGLGKFGSGVVDFGIAATQFAGDAAMNAIAPGSGLVAMGARALGGSAQEARNNGADLDTQFITGVKSAAIEVLTEKLFGAASKVAYGKGIIKNESFVNGLVNRLAKTDKGRTALKVIVGANEEGLEEVLSDILNPIADRVLKLDDGKGDWSDIGNDFDAEEMAKDYIIGAALGLTGAGTNAISGQYRAENAQQRAYEDYQRQLVNAGLASEQGSQAQLTAEEYQNILDNSTKRGKRNLSDKETKNLETLIRSSYAQEDAADISARLTQLGTQPEEQTVNAIVKTVNGEKLNTKEKRAFDANPYSQRVVNEMLDPYGITSNEWYADRASYRDFEPEKGDTNNRERMQGKLDALRSPQAIDVLKNADAVNDISGKLQSRMSDSLAARYNVSPEFVSRVYNLTPAVPPQAFETAFDAAYQMGQQGANKAALGGISALSEAQAEIAYNMGASTAQATIDNAAAQGDNVSTQVNNQVSNAVNNTIQEVNTNEIRLRNSGQRLNGQNTRGQVPAVERGAVEAYAGTDSGRQSGYSAAQGKAGQKVVYNGVEQENVYYSGEDTESMKKGRELARSYGYKVTYFEGGNIKDSDGEFRGMVDTESKTVMVRSDHPDMSAEQIMRHEMGHAAIAQGDISLDELRSAMLSDLSEKELNSAVEVYRHAYGDTISEDEAFEEMCCDALGKINIFAGTEHDSANYGKVQESFRKHTAETANKGRAPPKNGAKWSIEPINSYGGDISPESGSLKFSMQENDNITARTMKYYDKHHDDIEHISRAELEQANGIVDEMVDHMTPYLDRTNTKGLRFLPEEILGDTRFDNGSYGKTIENTTICFRTLAYIDFTNDVKEKIGRPLTVEESFLASQMLYDIAKEPQCLYCYVSLDRKAYDAFLLEYIKQRDAVITEYDALGEKAKEAYRKRKDKSNGKKDPLFKKFLNKRKATNNMRDRFNAWITLAENGDSLIGLSDLTTEEKRSQIKSKGGVMADQMHDIEQYAQSASWAKKLEQYRSYNGEILRMSDDLVKTLNSEYGLRFYSFSEYTPAFIVENMQQIRDAALKGFKGLAYTKKTDFARIFAPTGMNINISVFARMDNGKIVPDTLQGADWGEVQELRNQYDNVGAVFVATTDEMVDWALEQDWIDVVIPFHIVRTGANVAEFYKWVNHTSQQTDKKRNKNGRPGKKADITPPEHNNDFETYKRLVEKRNLIPRFEKWYGKDNYMKLVNETRRAASETPLLKPNFDDGTLSEAIKSFDSFVEEGGYYGDWYETGTDYVASVDTVANDILSGKRANEVDYGRQDFDASEAMKHRKERQHGRSFSREPESISELRRQNEQLKKRVEYWRGQTKTTRVKTVRQSDVNRLAREVIDMSESDLKPRDITERLSKLGEHILNEKELRYTDVAEMAQDIAEDVVSNATMVVNEDDVQTHNRLKDYLKRVKLKDDGSAEFESIRNSYKRRIMFNKNGLSVDSAYAELNSMFGEGYFPEDIINPADQLERIAEVLDGTAPQYANPNGYYAEEAAEYMRNYIIDSMLSDQVRQTAPTMADKAAAREAKLKADNAERIKSAVKKERERNEVKLQRFKEGVARLDSKRKETALRNRYKGQIEKNVNTLSKWLLNPDHKNTLKHIPGQLQSTVRDFIAAIDFTSSQQLGGGAPTIKDMKYIDSLDRLRRYIADSKVGEDRYSDLDLPPEFETQLADFVSSVNALARNNKGTYTINDMTSEQLKELSDIVKTMKKAITDMNRLYQNATFQHVYEAGESDIETLREYIKTKAFTSKLAANRLDQAIMWESSRPAHVFKRFGKGGESMYQEFVDGQNTMAFLTKEVIDFAEDTYTTAEVKQWAKEIHEFEFGDKRVKLTSAQLMSLYELNKRSQAKQHLDSGGFRVANFKDGKFNLQTDKEKHVFTDTELNEMFGELTDRQKDVADKLQRFMVEHGGEWGNYVSRKRFDVEMFKDENYFPIKIDTTETDSKVDEKTDNASLYQLLNMGFTKETSAKANQSIVVYDIFDVFANHMAEMAQYRSFALPLLDMTKWFNIKMRDEKGNVTASLRTEMRRAFGSDKNGRGFAEQFVTGIIKAYNGAEGRGDSSINSRMINRVNRAAVAYNMRVMIQQPSAIVRAALYLDPKDLISSLKNYAGISTKKNIEEMHKYSGIALWKDLGFYDVNVSRGVQELIKHSQGTISKINEIGMKGAEFADKVTWAALWDASKKQVRRETGLSESDAEFFPKVSKVFENVIYNTQVVDTVLTKSEVSRNRSSGARLFTSFMSEPMTTASLVTSEIFDIQMRQAKGIKLKPSDYSRLSKTCIVVAVAAVVNSALASLADAWRDDDEYGTFEQKWTRAMRIKLADELNPLTYLPYASNVWDVTKAFLDWTDTKWFGVEVYGNGTDIPLADILESTEKAVKIFDEIREKGEDSKYTKFGGYYKVVNVLSKITGIPLYNIAREGVSLYNAFASDKIRSYEPSKEGAVKYAWNDGYLTDDEAIAALQDDAGMDEGEAWLEVEKWKNDTTSNYTKLHDAIDNGGDIKKAVDELTEHGVEEKNIKSSITRRYKEAYINGDNKEREKIRKAMYATGLYGSVNEVIEKCNSWLK